MADTDALDWVRLDTNMHVQPKIIRLVQQPSGGAAAFAWVCSITHGGLVLSNGHIGPESLALVHCTKKLAGMLVAAGLWDVDEARGGWTVHDYAKYNPTRETTQMIRQSKQIGGIRGNHEKNGHQPGTCNCEERIKAIERGEMPDKFSRT